MKKRLLAAIAVLMTLMFANSCASGLDSDKLITSVIEENLRAAEAEDIEAYMATVSEESPQYESTKIVMKQMFDGYDMEYEVHGLKVVEKTEEKADVAFEQITRIVSEPGMKNTRVSGTHTLLKAGEEWKIYSTIVNKVEYVD